MRWACDPAPRWHCPSLSMIGCPFHAGGGGGGDTRLLPSLHERVRTQTGLGNGGGSGGMGAPRSGGACQGLGGKKIA